MDRKDGLKLDILYYKNKSNEYTSRLESVKRELGQLEMYKIALEESLNHTTAMTEMCEEILKDYKEEANG